MKSIRERHASSSKQRRESAREAKKTKAVPLSVSAPEPLTSQREAPSLSKPVFEKSCKWPRVITGLNTSKTSITISTGTTSN